MPITFLSRPADLVIGAVCPCAAETIRIVIALLAITATWPGNCLRPARRLTLFAELIDTLDRENVRYSPPSVDNRTREARGPLRDDDPHRPFRGSAD